MKCKIKRCWIKGLRQSSFIRQFFYVSAIIEKINMHLKRGLRDALFPQFFQFQCWLDPFASGFPVNAKSQNSTGQGLE